MERSIRQQGNYRLPTVASIAIEGAILQMPKCLNLTIAGIVACLVVGCATQSKPTLVSGQSHAKTCAPLPIRHTERGGAHNALGAHLSGRHVMSAASDWSRFPLGTRFRIADTNEEYMIDDYGIALDRDRHDRPLQGEPPRHETLGRAPRRYRYFAMGLGGTELESARAALQTSLCPADGREFAAEKNAAAKELIASLDPKKPQQKKKT